MCWIHCFLLALFIGNKVQYKLKIKMDAYSYSVHFNTRRKSCYFWPLYLPVQKRGCRKEDIIGYPRNRHESGVLGQFPNLCPPNISTTFNGGWLNPVMQIGSCIQISKSALPLQTQEDTYGIGLKGYHYILSFLLFGFNKGFKIKINIIYFISYLDMFAFFIGNYFLLGKIFLLL